MHSYYYELAKGRINEWHEEANQARRVQLVKARKRSGRGSRRILRPNPRLNLPATSLFDDLAQG